MRILIVEDDLPSRLILETVLRRLGHDTDTAEDGHAAWERFREARPDVVISDRVMPHVDGLELSRRIRTSGSAYTYVILLTSLSERHEVIAGMEAGVDDYLTKPLDVDDLRARLVAAERVTSLHRELATQRTALQELNDELFEIARTDTLTGLGNRLRLDEDLAALQGRVERYGHVYCLALFDLDHFKSFNDRYGHAAGDDALRRVADVLRRESRRGDRVYRYGGEELLVVFPEQTVEQASAAVSRMCASVRALDVPHEGSPLGRITVSAGLAELGAAADQEPLDVLKEADAALYDAKRAGRDGYEVRGVTTRP